MKQGKCKEKSDLANFQVVSEYRPSGDQPKAIEALAEGVLRGDRAQTLLGVTGSGKTYTMANVIEQVQPAHPGACPQQDAGSPALQRVPASFFRTMRWNISSPTMTTISRRPIFPRPTPLLKRTPPSTRRSTSCATPPRRPFLSVGTSSSWRRCPAFTAWATPRSIPSWPCRCARGMKIGPRRGAAQPGGHSI